MPVALTGEVGNNDVTAPDWATFTAPTNGDDVDAPVIISGVQRLLDNDADLAAYATGVSADLQASLTGGAKIIRHVTSIAALKALAGGFLVDGAVCMVRDPIITGSDVSRVGLFVYDASATEAECSIPAATDAYLVVTPNGGVGRWFNVAAGLGWKTGGAPEFLPKPRERVVRWQIVGSGTSTPTFSLTTSAWTQLPPVVAPVLGASDDFDFDFGFTMGAVSAADNYVSVRVEVSYNGGAYTPVTAATRQFTTSSTNTLDRHVIHIAGRHTASLGAGTYTFRIYGRTASVNADFYLHDEWTARGVQYVAL